MSERSWIDTAFARLVGVSPAMIVVLRFDGERASIELAGAAAAEVLDRRPEDLAGRSLTEVYPPDDARELVAHLREARRGGAVSYEAVRDLPTGRRTVLVDLLPLGDDRFLKYARDLSVEREAARRIDQLERVAGIGVYHWNARTDQIDWSDELYRILGYEPGEIDMTLERFFAHVHPDDRTKQHDLTDRAREEGTTVTTTFRLVRRDGEERLVEVRAEAAVGDDGQLVYALGTMQDITDRAELEGHAEDLRRAYARRLTGLEVHDKIVQGLSTIWLALQLDDRDGALQAVEATTTNAQDVVRRLLADMASTAPIAPGDLIGSTGSDDVAEG